MKSTKNSDGAKVLQTDVTRVYVHIPALSADMVPEMTDDGGVVSLETRVVVVLSGVWMFSRFLGLFRLSVLFLHQPDFSLHTCPVFVSLALLPEFSPDLLALHTCTSHP